MGREAERLPPGWEQPIPDSIWPEAMIAAVRADVGALAVPRVIASIRRWQEDARGGDARQQREARARLKALSAALCLEDGVEAADFEQVATALPESGEHSLAPASALARALSEIQRLAGGRTPAEKKPRSGATPQARIASNDTAGEALPIDDDAILAAEPTSMKKAEEGKLDGHSDSSRPARSGGLPKASPPPSFDAHENPTTLRPSSDTGPIMLPSVGLGSSGVPRADGQNPFEADDERPTRAIPIPSELSRRAQATVTPVDEGVLPPKKASSGVRAEAVDEAEAHVDPERTVAALSPPGPGAPDLEETAEPKNARLAPKPGIVRRRALSRRNEEPARPRAAMQQVKALHGVILPLCEELVPLSFERRSRRFWARWREVAGDRGVRREFVEDLLKTATEVRTLVCELIAEMQTVDPGSVYALVDKLEQSGEPRPSAPKPTVAPERGRGPLVGASVRVEGVSADEKKS